MYVCFKKKEDLKYLSQHLNLDIIELFNYNFEIKTVNWTNETLKQYNIGWVLEKAKHKNNTQNITNTSHYNKYPRDDYSMDNNDYSFDKNMDTEDINNSGNDIQNNNDNKDDNDKTEQNDSNNSNNVSMTKPPLPTPDPERLYLLEQDLNISKLECKQKGMNCDPYGIKNKDKWPNIMRYQQFCNVRHSKLSVAGLFNTGTNVIWTLIRSNCLNQTTNAKTSFVCYFSFCAFFMVFACLSDCKCFELFLYFVFAYLFLVLF